MRIPDEKQLFKEGDHVRTSYGDGVVEFVNFHSVYYEARPIASYIKYYYVVKISGERRSLKANEIIGLKL